MLSYNRAWIGNRDRNSAVSINGRFYLIEQFSFCPSCHRFFFFLLCAIPQRLSRHIRCGYLARRYRFFRWAGFPGHELSRKILTTVYCWIHYNQKSKKSKRQKDSLSPLEIKRAAKVVVVHYQPDEGRITSNSWISDFNCFILFFFALFASSCEISDYTS